MPADPRSLQITDRYRAQLLRLRQLITVGAARQWQAIDLDDLDAGFARWLAAVSALLGGGQRQAIIQTAAYLTAYMTSELDAPQLPPPIDVERYAGRSRDDRPLTEALTPPLFTVKMAIAQRKPVVQASASGLNRALRLVGAEVLAVPRAALRDAIHDDRRIVGWRRVTSGNACGACLGAATGAIHETDQVLDVHDHCRCSAEPVVRGVRERVRRPTGPELFDRLTEAQQGQLFHGRGGAEKAALIRSGDVPLADLITRTPMARMADQITETPLQQLVR